VCIIYNYLRRYNINSKEVLKILKASGFEKVSQKGSHQKLKNGNAIVIVAIHGAKDIPLGTLKNIERQSGVKLI